MLVADARDVRDLASLLAEVIRRAGAAYGSPEEWRRDITVAVKIMERNHRDVTETEARETKGAGCHA